MPAGLAVPTRELLADLLGGRPEPGGERPGVPVDLAPVRVRDAGAGVDVGPFVAGAPGQRTAQLQPAHRRLRLDGG